MNTASAAHNSNGLVNFCGTSRPHLSYELRRLQFSSFTVFSERGIHGDIHGVVYTLVVGVKHMSLKPRGKSAAGTYASFTTLSGRGIHGDTDVRCVVYRMIQA